MLWMLRVELNKPFDIYDLLVLNGKAVKHTSSIRRVVALEIHSKEKSVSLKEFNEFAMSENNPNAHSIDKYDIFAHDRYIGYSGVINTETMKGIIHSDEYTTIDLQIEVKDV